jgi:hypothetical protein
METKPLNSGREHLSSSGRIITREEYAAIMSEVSNMETGLKAPEKPMQIEERVRKLEFGMFILIGFVLVFFMLSRTG